MISKNRSIGLILAVILGLSIFFSSIHVFAAPPAPGPPPPGRVWVWIEPGWQLVNEPPPGHFSYKPGFWDPVASRWVRGAWVPGPLPPPPPGTPPPPAGPLHRKTWVWVDPHWELVAAPPPGPRNYVAGHWDPVLGKWVSGKWIIQKRRRGHVWVGGYWDRDKVIWIDGFWRPVGPPPPPGPPHPPGPPPPPPPGLHPPPPPPPPHPPPPPPPPRPRPRPGPPHPDQRPPR